MPDVPLNFSRAEFAERLARVRSTMQATGMECLIISDPSNMNWLTGYDGWSFYVHQAVVVPSEGEPIWFGRGQDANGAVRTCYMDEANIVGYADHYVQSTERHPMQELALLLEERGLGASIIGAEMDNYWFSAKAFAVLVHGLPNARFADVTGLVNWQRAIKSDQEIAYMRNAARIVERMHARIRDVAVPGMRKCDLVADIYDAGLRHADGVGGDYPAIVPLLPSGTDAAAPHLTWDDEPMRDGEGTFFEIAGCYKRYHCPLSRTMWFGKPPAHVADAQKAVLEGLDAGLEAARAGNTCEDIASAFFGVLKKSGIEKNNRTGYPIGVSYPPDWGERTMSLRMGDRSELKPGMTFHFMTGLWMDNWGLETTESILITDGAAECLSSVPRDIVVKD
ncbi:ectoine hydrolase DoeA [Tepidamorphus sp. 3E244]|uniref:ectoine hydrolase DoeA n=1 Tax=Tepidamorphus sp. 3E244 TaxID=3385498 RepID=UPI0038FCDF06